MPVDKTPKGSAKQPAEDINQDFKPASAPELPSNGNDAAVASTENRIDPAHVDLDVDGAKTSSSDTEDRPQKANEDNDIGSEGDDFSSLEHGLDDIPDAGPRHRPSKLKRFFAGYWRRKLWTIPVTLLVIIGVLAAVPVTRYFILGQFMSKHFKVVLVDQKTGKPVSGAKISSDGASATTDSKGEASLMFKVGKHRLNVDKKYYSAFGSTVFVGLKNQTSAQSFTMMATGRLVPISVTDSISGAPLAEASVKAAGSEVKTDKSGKVTMALPTDQPELNVSVNAKGYNQLKTTIKMDEQTGGQVDYKLTASGKLYFLSKQTGKIDVVSTNLDGSNRQTVLAGTGKEDDATTQLLASRDWHYLALLSKRGSETAKLYLIDTDTDKMTVIDGANANFTLAGWTDHYFVYSVTRQDMKEWEPNRVAIKSFNADSNQNLTVEQNQVEGSGQFNYIAQTLSNVYAIDGQIFYTATWPGQMFGSQPHANLIRVASPKTGAKKDVKSFQSNDYAYLQAFVYKPDEIYVGGYSAMNNKSNYFEVEFGDTVEFKGTSLTDESYYRLTYTTYLTSPNGTKTFWSEQRDGRNVFFVGDSSGDNGKQVAALDEYTVYGWYTDDFLLVSKKGSELFIMPAKGGTPVKISDYHKPAVTIRGYGGGYGGL